MYVACGGDNLVAFLIKYTEMYAQHLPRLYFVEVFGHLQIDPNPCIACESLSVTSAFRAILFLTLFYSILAHEAFDRMFYS